MVYFEFVWNCFLAKFVRIVLSDGSQVDLTDDHLIFVKNGENISKIPAEDVKVGNQILTENSNLSVTAIHSVLKIPISPQVSLEILNWTLFYQKVSFSKFWEINKNPEFS